MLNGKAALRPEEVASDHECEFGQWYFGGDGQTLLDRPYFKEVGIHHAKIHQYAQQIAELMRQGQKDRAQALMAEFEQVREDFFTALDELYLR